MRNYKLLLELRTVLRALEKESGLDDLSGAELDILLVAKGLSGKFGEVVNSKDIRDHELIRSFPPATYHRALRMLLERGLLRRAEGAKAKSYIVAVG